MMATAAAVAMTGAQAQVLTDPTRPPSALSGSPAAQEEPAGTQLQSVLLSSGRKVAVINGAMVPLGGMVGEAKVVRISETEVVLKKGDETEVLKLFPGVDKLPSKRRAARTGAGGAGSASTRQGGSK
jgi:MSHA biogenesis protein MshK